MQEKLISSKTVFEGRAVRLRIDTIEKSSGVQTTREIVEHADCIAVVVLDDKDNVIMERQYRTATGKVLLEIPAGGMEEGESPEDAVRRELQEEIGYLPGKVTSLGGFYAAPGYCTEYLHLFLATDLVQSHLTAEDTDEIEIVRVPVSQIKSLIEQGEICDAKSVAGLLRFLIV
ncbi:MAG: NUDIX hydrolase [Chloroflexi bacterium]|nr:NUDIX hydrolase [Chloroflexota bacterium]